MVHAGVLKAAGGASKMWQSNVTLCPCFYLMQCPCIEHALKHSNDSLSQRSPQHDNQALT